ncbi:MAG: hypothetical protein L0Z50_04300 [Verrucomicrobiales bacterium]|nr:hypothetical protein [Verrucomicrobiales bacterium]
MKAQTFKLGLMVTALFAINQWQAVAAHNPSLWLRFDETAGTITADSSGNGNNAVFSADPIWAAGQVGNAATFNGAYADIPNSPSIDISGTNITIAFWINTVAGPEAGGDAVIVSKPYNANDVANGTWTSPYYQYGVERDGRHLAFLFFDETSTLHEVKSPDFIRDNTWFHFAVTYDGALVRWYVNGVLLKSANLTGSIQAVGNRMRIAADERPGQLLRQRLDDLRIYSRTLDDTAISALAATNGFGRTTFDDTKTQVTLPTDTPPVIDGVIDANEWGSGTRWRVAVDPNLSDGIRSGELTLGTAPTDSDDLSFQIFTRYDANNLYVAVQVRDSSIQTDSADADSANGSTWEDDSVEVFVDGANANDRTWAAGQIGGQFVVTANNAYRENEAANPGYGPNAAWYARTTPAADGSGYDAKFRISLATLGNPKPGDVIGFTVAVNDDDDGSGRERQVVWAGIAHQPATYGNLVLGGKSYSAPKTSVPTIDGVINPAEYAGATEIKVDRSNGIYDPGSGDDTWGVGDLSYSAWVVHDADAVYVAVDVTDDNVVNDTAEAGSEDGQTWVDDSVEIFFDADYSHDAGRGAGQFEGQYVFTANGAWRDNEANNPTFGASADWFAATSKTAKGYQIEFKVKKSALFNPQDGATLGFHIAANDDDGSGRKAQLGWSGHAHNEYTYGELKLTGPPTQPVAITAKLVGGKVELAWSSGGVLETRASLSAGSWAPVPGAASGIHIDPTTAAAGYYRLRL